MILIAHRGNINGKSDRENHPDYIKEALDIGYNVEVDVWYDTKTFYLGHDRPEYDIDEDFLKDSRIWCHAKTSIALHRLLELNTICFFHDTDEVTLTSNGYIWTFPGKSLTKKSICVLPEESRISFPTIKCSGICSDIINLYKKE